MLRIELTTDRRLVSLETDDMKLKLNGKDNATYKKMLAQVGIDLVFVQDKKKEEGSSNAE